MACIPPDGRRHDGWDIRVASDVAVYGAITDYAVASGVVYHYRATVFAISGRHGVLGVTS